MRRAQGQMPGRAALVLRRGSGCQESDGLPRSELPHGCGKSMKIHENPRFP